MVYVNGHPSNISESTFIAIFLVVLFIYAIPSVINFWKLFSKAGKPGWAVFVPFYGPIVAAQIGKRPLWVAVLFSLIGAINFSSNSSAAYGVSAVQDVLSIMLGLVLLTGLAKQYKAGKGFWMLLVLLPITAFYSMDSVKYRPQKTSRTKK